MSFTIEKDKYTVATTTPADVISHGDKATTQIWLRTPALDQSLIDKIVQIQLETKSRDQGWVSAPDAGSWSWFDIIVLDSPGASDIKVKDGLALAWLSHDNKLGVGEYTKQVGPVLGSKHDIFNGLEAGNALAVRVCAQFPGWENHASEARLILKVSEKGRHNWQPSSDDEDKAAYLGVVTEQITKLGETFDAYLSDATPADAPPAYSLVREMLPTGPLRADQREVAEEPPLRLLSLDGGGVRGISSLYILQAIMAKLSSDPNVKPCKYFDMVAGTSTGGLIAIMLGRLQMTIPECIKVYTQLASQIFSANAIERAVNFAGTGAYYKKDNFEKGLKALIKQKTGDENAPMLDPDTSNKCKVFVVSGQSQSLNHTSAEQFRTYPTKFPDAFAGCAIWQAARATSAAPTYLPAIKINSVEFVDGGLKFNNPSILIMGEVNAIFGIARHIECLLTIGTGMQPNNAIDRQPITPLSVPGYVKSVAEAAIRVATDCENTHQLAQTLFIGRDDTYFRFNAGVRVGTNNWGPMIALDDWKGMDKLVAVTKTYLGGQTKRIEQCAGKLVV
ncbi:acyl transferase/acyl hydrolase/lysophospholipase [Lyophyllum atratum]|nr:acyl transferase/acyl hydrolase/lysophospholipase [Lyophyllum atratum]